MMPSKEVSVGEFDARSGLTHITLQRGRLMFHMGTSSARRAASAPLGKPSMSHSLEADFAPLLNPSDTCSPPSIHEARRRSPKRMFRSGPFTGRSLYAEEAVYLVKCGALVVYEMEEIVWDECNKEVSLEAAPVSDTRPQLTYTQLIAHTAQCQFVSPSALAVYAFLKDHKLHPRRAVDTTAPPSTPLGTTRGAFVFDVFKSITETHLTSPTEGGDSQASSIAESTDKGSSRGDWETQKVKKRKLRRLALILRVVVDCFSNGAALSPRDLRSAVEAQSGTVPIKLAVADADGSVLLFEVQ